MEEYKGARPQTAEGQLLQQAREYLYVAEAVYAHALVETGQNVRANEKTAREGGKTRYSFLGYDPESGKGIYEGNFPAGTPKAAKAERILYLIQNVWSKKPIPLLIKESNGTTRKIFANFDPTYSPDKQIRTDASKLMGGNRHGNAKEQRVTLVLADDYYQIASESHYNYSKVETGKTSFTHEGVKQWHYFVNDILFLEQGGDRMEPYRVTINVKEKTDGSFVYSYNAESKNKTEGDSTRRTLHADVNSNGNTDAVNASPSCDIVAQEETKVKAKPSQSNPALGEVLEAEDAAIREDIPKLREMISLLKTVPGGLEFSRRTVESVARVPMQRTGVSGNVKELADVPSYRMSKEDQAVGCGWAIDRERSPSLRDAFRPRWDSPTGLKSVHRTLFPRLRRVTPFGSLPIYQKRPGRWPGLFWYAGRDSNPQPSEPESDALSIEPPAHLLYSLAIIAKEIRFVKGKSKIIFCAGGSGGKRGCFLRLSVV